MKRIIAAFLVSVFALPVLSTITVVVHAEDTTTSTTNTSTTTPSSSDTTTQKPAETGDDAKSIADRIAQRKAALKTKLTTLEKTRVMAKCKASQQGGLNTEKGRVKGLETSRTEVYKNLLNRLTNLSDGLKAKGMDTTSLNADIDTLKTKIDTFNTDLTAYKQAVSDLAGMDCATDPDGFKASLETARTALKKVNDDALAVRTYLTTTIKPLLVTIRGTLEKSEAEAKPSTTTPSTSNTGTTNSTTTSGSN